MKNLLLFTICLLVFQSLYSQTVTVSEALTLRNDTNYEVIGNLFGNTLVFQEQTTEFEVQCFDHNLQMSWEKELELDKKRPELIGIVPTLEDFSVFYHFRRKGDIVVKAHKYDAGANLIDSTTVYDFGRLFYTPKFEVIRSEDKSKVLLYYFENGEDFHAYSFDLKRMKFLWKKSLLTEKIMFNRKLRELLVDNDGNMHMIYEKDNRRLKLEDHHFEIFEYGERTGMTVHRYTIGMPELQTYDIYFKFDDLNERLIAGGLYIKENKVWAEGYFFLSIPPKNPDAFTLVSKPFNEELIATLREKEVNKSKGIPETEIREIVLRRDGGIILIGELSKRYERRGSTATPTYYGRNNYYQSMDFYFDDLFVISIHPNGEEHWKNVLHKKQYSQDDDAAYSSYFLLKTPSALRLIFNDEIKLESTVSEYVLKGNGAYDRNAVMSTESQKLRLRFRDAVQVASNELIVPSEMRSRLKLVRVVF